MKDRCYRTNFTSYKYYGKRGIKVCKQWHIFINFYHDMYESYKKHFTKFGKQDTSLDRIDNNGNYTPNNCK